MSEILEKKMHRNKNKIFRSKRKEETTMLVRRENKTEKEYKNRKETHGKREKQKCKTKKRSTRLKTTKCHYNSECPVPWRGGLSWR